MDDRRILEHYPLPIARGYLRYRNAAEDRERHDAAYYLFEVYLKYTAAIAIAHYVASEKRDHRVNAALKGLVRPTLGEWLLFLRECARFLEKGSDVDPAVRAVAELLRSREGASPGALELLNASRSLHGGEPSGRTRTSLDELLAEIVTYRNRHLGHGARLSTEHCQRFTPLLVAALIEVLERSPFLTARRLVRFDRGQVREDLVECGVVELMSDRPIRRERPHRIRYGEIVPAENALHLLDAEGKFTVLSPLLVARHDDVYFLNDARGVPEYLSYSTGDHFQPTDIGGDQRRFFERILGYEVDASHLSQMGQEIAALAEPAGGSPEHGEERRLGDYRIIREIGRGGMGTVFEAVQGSLGRRVALKVLPGTFAIDPRRIERFRREARATARIHHPAIVPVYDVGEAEGTHFYAMEYIEGATLDAMIETARKESANPMPRKHRSTSDPSYIADAVERTAVLAEGLEEAHRLGLVHRDIKPSNVLVDRTGRHVLIDFGLVHEETAETLTRSGDLVGTLRYMSPEQVSRRPADARSDVFSLAVLLYELLTLRLPFEGESDHDVQNAILFRDPVPPRRLNPRIHRDLEIILLHALEKDPDQRYASAGELAADLRRLLRIEPIRAKPVPVLRRVFRTVWVHRGKTAALAALVAILVTGIVLWCLWPKRHPVLVQQRRLTTDVGLTTEPCLSPDGSFVVYATTRGGRRDLDLWVHPLDGGTPRRITSHEGDDREPDVSPDGRTVAFRSEEDGGGIFVVPVEGGRTRRVAGAGRRPRFSPDGKRIVYWVGPLQNAFRHGQVFITRLDGGEPVEIAPHFDVARYPLWSPDGRHILFAGSEQPDDADWWVVPADGGAASRTGVFDLLAKSELPKSSGHQRLLTGGNTIPSCWISRGGLVFFSTLIGDSVSLWVAMLSQETFRALEVTRLTTGTVNEIQPTVAGEGVVAYASLVRNVEVFGLPLEASRGMVTGDLERWTTNVSTDREPSISADGTRVVFISERTGNADVFLRNRATGAEESLTRTPETEHSVKIRSDGAIVAYDRDLGGVRPVFVAGIEDRSERRVCDDCGTLWSWSTDGTRLLYAPRGVRPWKLAVLDLTTGAQRIVLEDPAHDIYQGQFSPDGRRIAFNAVRRDAAESHIYVAAYGPDGAADAEQWIRLTAGRTWNDKPRWSPDGGLLYCVSDRGGQLGLWVHPVSESGEPGGEPFELRFRIPAELSLANAEIGELDIAVGVSAMALGLQELTGNIWLASLEERR
jgi:serine/threonine protein kinase/Tol biopolymer transport system component